MRKMLLYWEDRFGEEESLVGTLWVEGGRLVVQPSGPELRKIIDALMEWFSSRNLCSREVVNFPDFTSFEVAAECRPEDQEYLETLALAAGECPLGERRVRGRIAEA